MSFTEDFLHYIWKFKLADLRDLTTVSGETIHILLAGNHNKNAGPDFEHAAIRLDGTRWVGNIEIHINSSDWDKHNHSRDPAYDTVILHVVYHHDKPVLRADGTQIPTLELKSRIPDGISSRYKSLMQNMNWIPCEQNLAVMPKIYINSWLSRVLIERLEQKAIEVKAILTEFKGSWDDTFYLLIARNFGFKVNAFPFEVLARSLPQKILSWHRKNELQVAALIFGQAGFLNPKSPDEYSKSLYTEYAYLKKKYGLGPMDKSVWKFLRMRPQNFPTLRLAQFAALVLKSSHLFSKVIEKWDAESLKNMFTDLPVNEYWKTHFRFGKESNVGSAQPGQAAINNILLNTVSVVLYSYGKETGNDRYINRALDLLAALPPETNQITSRFIDMGIENDHADTSQALLQLKKYYCDAKKCLHCGIGTNFLKQE